MAGAASTWAHGRASPRGAWVPSLAAFWPRPARGMGVGTAAGGSCSSGGLSGCCCRCDPLFRCCCCCCCLHRPCRRPLACCGGLRLRCCAAHAERDRRQNWRRAPLNLWHCGARSGGWMRSMACVHRCSSPSSAAMAASSSGRWWAAAWSLAAGSLPGCPAAAGGGAPPAREGQNVRPTPPCAHAVVTPPDGAAGAPWAGDCGSEPRMRLQPRQEGRIVSVQEVGPCAVGAHHASACERLGVLVWDRRAGRRVRGARAGRGGRRADEGRERPLR